MGVMLSNDTQERASAVITVLRLAQQLFVFQFGHAPYPDTMELFGRIARFCFLNLWFPLEPQEVANSWTFMREGGGRGG